MAQQVMFLNRLERQIDTTATTYEVTNQTETEQYALECVKQQKIVAWHEQDAQAIKDKIDAFHSQAAHERRQEKMDFARAESIRVATESSASCGIHEEVIQDAVEAWEMRCLSPGIVWAGVSAGAKHTCALAKESQEANSGAMCCWGGMGRYNAFGRMEVLRSGVAYEYHGEKDAETVPSSIMGDMYDATPDTVHCEQPETAVIKTESVPWHLVGRGYCATGGDDPAGDSSLAACQSRCEASESCSYYSAKSDGGANVDCMLYSGCAGDASGSLSGAGGVYVTYVKPGAGAAKQLCSGGTVHIKGHGGRSVGKYLHSNSPEGGGNSWGGKNNNVNWKIEWDGELVSGKQVNIFGKGIGSYLASNSPEGGGMSWGGCSSVNACSAYNWKLEWDGELVSGKQVYLYGMSGGKYLASNHGEGQGFSWGGKSSNYNWQLEWNENDCGTDLSTGQPAEASSSSSTAWKAVDGDTGRTHPNEFHSSGGTNEWLRVQLKSTTTNPEITIYARDCCTSDYGKELFFMIGATDDKSKATDCGSKSGIEASSTHTVTCAGTGQYVWIRGDPCNCLKI